MKTIFPYLTYAGTIPFIFCTLCLIFDIHLLSILGLVEKIMSVYSLVIASFMAGAHWGQHLKASGIWSRTLPILSNLIAIVLWLGFLILSFKVLMALFVTAFVILLFIDYRLFQRKLITGHYFQTRLFVSVIVILSIIISGTVS